MAKRTRRPDRAAVSSNGVAIPFDEQHFTPMRESKLDNPESLRRAFDEQGYVLIRSLLERAPVLALRAKYFERFDPDYLAPGTTAGDGVVSCRSSASRSSAGRTDYGKRGHPAYDLVRSPDFDRFTRAARLREVAEILLDGPGELLPRRIVRHFDRSSAKASRAHVDYDYMDRGGDEVVTAWIPLGDCPIDCGGLVYLEDSHELPRARLDVLRSFTDRPSDPRPISNDLGRTARTLGGRWLWTDFGAGDVVFHSPHTVHASLDVDSDVMRLSADIRFRRVGSAPDERWNGDWSADDGF